MGPFVAQLGIKLLKDILGLIYNLLTYRVGLIMPHLSCNSVSNCGRMHQNLQTTYRQRYLICKLGLILKSCSEIRQNVAECVGWYSHVCKFTSVKYEIDLTMRNLIHSWVSNFWRTSRTNTQIIDSVTWHQLDKMLLNVLDGMYMFADALLDVNNRFDN